MNRKLLAGAVLIASQMVEAAEPSLCSRLADEIRQAPAATWALPDPLSAWVQQSQPATASPTVSALAGDARWHDRLSVPESRPLPVQQLEGTPVYMVDEVAGSAACQSLLLIHAQPGQPAREIAPPFDLDGADMSLCTTQSAGFARVLGQPAFIVGGAPFMTSPDLDYRIATWSDGGWAQRCRLTVRRTTALTVGQRYCAPGSEVCDAGQPVAQRLAQAYETARAAKRPLDAAVFNGGRSPDATIAAALNPPLAVEGAVGNMNPPFPTFGADDRRLNAMLTVFSNADPRVLPVQVEGRWWLAVVGRSGVGWREGDAVLVALFAPPGRATDGVASYQFLSRPAALREARATDVMAPKTRKAR